jgi:hypothetical protein
MENQLFSTKNYGSNAVGSGGKPVKTRRRSSRKNEARFDETNTAKRAVGKAK